MLKKLSGAVASLAMLAAVPAAAAPLQSSGASSLSVANNVGRAGAPHSGKASKLGEGAGGIAAIALALGIVAIGVVAAVSDDSSNSDSP